MKRFNINKRVNPFVQIDKECINDSSVSWRAKGILAYLLSKPDNWQVYEQDIINHSTDGRDAVRNSIKELIRAGYISKEQSRTKGKFASNDYTVSDTKMVDEASKNAPSPEKPSTVNPLLSNNELNNTEPTLYRIVGEGKYSCAVPYEMSVLPKNYYK
jgi:hypothetical protein